MLGADGPEGLICSRKGCAEHATVHIVWRNPRIHDEHREKLWASCPGHEEFFVEYLSARNFPVTTRPLGVAP